MKIKFILLPIILFINLWAFSQTTTVYTCKGGAVAAHTSSEFSGTQISYLNSETMSQFGYLGITFLANSSAQYNCHSYAWHLREGNNNKVWINNANYQIGSCYNETHNIDTYWTDGCFIQVCNEVDADKLHYYCGDHSAVASTTNAGYYESKWGQLAVVRHTRTGVPYADPANSVNFYASTKVNGDISNLCTGNRTFTVKNITGATYAWTSSSGVSAVGSSTSNSFTVQRNGSLDGNNWVEVTITTACSNVSAVRRIDFPVGLPNIDFVAFSNGANGDGYFCTSHTGNQFEPFFSPTPGSGSIEYRLLSWPSLRLVYTSPTAYSVGAPVPVGSSFAPGWYVLGIRLTTDCGTTQWVEYEVEFVNCSMLRESCTDCSFKLTASPNPAKGDLNISIDEEIPAVKALSKNERVKYVLYDFNRTQIVKQWVFDNGQNRRTLNVRDIKPGQYLIVVTKGKYRQSRQIIIN